MAHIGGFLAHRAALPIAHHGPLSCDSASSRDETETSASTSSTNLDDAPVVQLLPPSAFETSAWTLLRYDVLPLLGLRFEGQPRRSDATSHLEFDRNGVLIADGNGGFARQLSMGWEFICAAEESAATALRLHGASTIGVYPDMRPITTMCRPACSIREDPVLRHQGARAQRVAVFEMCDSSAWAVRGAERWSSSGFLLPRLEAKLRVTLSREQQSLHMGELSVLHAVAAVGVVAPTSCREVVVAAVTASSPFPLLYQLMTAGRFIWVGLASEAASGLAHQRVLDHSCISRASAAAVSAALSAVSSSCASPAASERWSYCVHPVGISHRHVRQLGSCCRCCGCSRCRRTC